ncbi:hypothetical protein ACWF99_23705 [Nocardia sp. NPDC055002]
MTIAVRFVNDDGDALGVFQVPLMSLTRVRSEPEALMWDQLRAAARGEFPSEHWDSADDFLANRICKARRSGFDWAFISGATQLTGHRVREIWAEASTEKVGE